MLKKVVLVAAAGLTAVAVTGCTGSSGEPAGAGGGVPSASAPAGAASAPARATSAPETGSSNGGAAQPTRTSDAGDGGNWFANLEACPNEGQKAEVQRLEFADVTGDGVDDALVARTCEAFTAYIPSTVEVFDGTTAGDAKPKRIGVLLKDAGQADLPWFTSMSAKGGTVTIKAYGVAENGIQACPELKLTYVYRFGDGKFERTGRTATNAGDCLRIA
ncbi:hypothetical protein AB0G04_07885 [Actinoplanes sp. NPDC023801]|uniref:hypothetical protein n=1 Tax=Actinoplanes sp. NPDC023801 TaxID=3154595 RepID=UPI0033F33F11